MIPLNLFESMIFMEKLMILKKQCGFTLIELLVVIAVITVLMGILLPTLSKARKQARSTVCRVNLKTVQLGHILYMQTNDGVTIPHPGAGKGAAGMLWVNELADNIEDVDEARYCPEAKAKNFNPNASTSAFVEGSVRAPWGMRHPGAPLDEDYELGSYTINGWLYSHQIQPQFEEDGYDKDVEVKDSALVPAFMDGIWFDTWPRNESIDLAQIDYQGSRSPPTLRVLINRHGRHGNIVYFDGHAEAVYLPEYFMQKWNKSCKPNPEMVNKAPIPK